MLFWFLGQKGFSFYFIVSGRVAVERIEVDKSTGMRHVQVSFYEYRKLRLILWVTFET